MRRFLLITIVALCWCVGSHAIEPKGKYISQSGELLFRFVADSLYIDIAQSQRNLSAFKLVKSKQSTEETTAYNALRGLSEEWTSDLQRSAHPRHPAKRQGVPAGILWQGQRPRLQLQRTLQHQVCRITKRKHSFCTPRA